ncbi:oligosaccharyl transferase glycoprotein complex, beta subunit [Pichia californica]|uniref:Dolichyl-diphosphooligosaccharide--protein glycosyltransferase subunit WBP1 n=1 Tax=Pichia californica TaxID=460514 RepID=A0A9P6WMQ1_9ASCO|nr:oligosaccharyl transferase glycoprotein complex, beta subunit [[Candida] californica]KAG0689922.1 oligosaccharyl transferase glycoprotein complex, beta subunit [[Candida] californica]
MAGWNIARLVAVLFSLLTLCCAQILNTLVLYDSDEDLTTYSHLIETLHDNRLSTDFHKVGVDEETQIIDINNKILYSNILILPNRAKKLSVNIDHDTLLTYANNGGNLLLISEDLGTQLDTSIFLNQLGIYPSPKGYTFNDFHSEESIDSFKPEFLNKYIIDDNTNNEISTISFANSAVALISNSEYLIPLLRTSRTSSSKNEDDLIWHSGNQGYLSVAFQGLNNGRVLWLGSPASLKNDSLNKKFVNDIIQWTFQLKSVIKATFSTNKRVDSLDPSIELPFVDADDYYKIKDTTYYEIGLSKYEFENDKWVPFTLDDESDHIQLEFIMLDPYYRLNLNHTASTENEAIYSALFKIPDQHGMFTFSVDYKRPGLSYVTVEEVVPIRHLANDEYARSWEIPNSKVYMAGYGVVVAAWLFFVILFIFSGKKNIDSSKKNN